MNLGNKIHELRKKHYLSQEQLAEKVGVARQTISKWELGETSPDIKQARVLSQIFNVSIDELVNNDTNEIVYYTDERKRIITKSFIKKAIIVIAAAICLCFVVVCILTIINRSQILYPQGIYGNVVITRRESIQIGKGNTETIVFDEDNKPTVSCQLPEGFTANAEVAGFYTDESGNFINFNTDYAEKVVNPLLETEYYSYYDNAGYHSYMDMARMAMYVDLSKVSIFSSKEQIHIAGGSQIIRAQLCAGQNADYYDISGGLTEDGKRMRLYGFALHFDNTTWLITLKDCNDIYYYITIKDPSGVGKSSDTIGEFLSSICVAE